MNSMRSMIPQEPSHSPIVELPTKYQRYLTNPARPSQRPPPEPTVISPQSQTKVDNLDPRPIQEFRPTQIINENAKNIPTNPLVPPDIPRSVPASRPRFPYSD